MDKKVCWTCNNKQCKSCNAQRCDWCVNGMIWEDDGKWYCVDGDFSTEIENIYFSAEKCKRFRKQR